MKLLKDRLDAANAKISDLNKMLGSSQAKGKKETQDLTEKLGAMKGLNEELQSKLEVSLASAKELEKELEVMKNSMVKMAENLDEARNAEKDARAGARGLVAELQEERDQSKRTMEAEASKAEKKVAKLTEYLERSKEVARGLEKEVKRLGGQLGEEVAKTKGATEERDELRARVKALEDEAQASASALKEIEGSEAEAKELRTILSGKDEEIANLQATVHRECMERTAILERLKDLQAKTGVGGTAKVVPSAPSGSTMSPTAPEFRPKAFTPTTPPKDDADGDDSEVRASQQWMSGSGGRAGGRGRGRGGRNRGRRKGGTMVDG